MALRAITRVLTAWRTRTSIWVCDWSCRRKQDWWARDNKYWRNLFNPDQINLTVVRDPAKRYEAFRRGDSDLFRIATAEMWYDNLPEDDPEIANGYIHKSTFYNGGPRSNWGLWMNSSRHLLDNQDIRTGIQFATNWQLVIDSYFRGDMEQFKNADGWLRVFFAHFTGSAPFRY